MREPLNVGKKYKLYKTAYGNNEYHEFVIDGLVGYGATCVVYDAHFDDELRCVHRCRLKECFPVNGTFEVRIDDEIDWTSNQSKEEALDKFEKTYAQQLSLQSVDVFVNPMSKIMDAMYYGNGTQYVAMELDYGTSFDDSEKKSLFDVLQQIKSLATVVDKYHELGYLHLDIKPENFMPLPDMNNSVKLFDFDSVFKICDIMQQEIALSYSKEYAAPEVLGLRKEEICEASDIYSIGCVLHYALYGTPPSMYDFLKGLPLNKRSSLYENVNPAVQPKLTKIIKKCLSASLKYRYKNAKEFCEDLSKVIELVKPESFYFEKREINAISSFSGRIEELNQIKNALIESNYVFVTGMGGIGKSTLVKEYCKRNEGVYDSIIYVYASGSILETVVDNLKFPIHNFSSNDDLEYKTEDVLFQNKLKCMEGFVDEKTLVVIDNVSDIKDPDIAKLLALKWKIVFITRPSVSAYGYRQIEIGRADDESLKDIFEESSGEYIGENKDVFMNMVNRVEGHTLIIELIGKQIKASHKGLKHFVNLISQQGLFKGSHESLDIRKDENAFYNGDYGEIIKRILFENELSDKETGVLNNLAFFPVEGVSIDEFQTLCGISDCSAINRLIALGWIICSADNSTIWMHALIREIILANVDSGEIKILISNLAYIFLPMIREIYPLQLIDFAEKKLVHNKEEDIERRDWHIEVARELFERKFNLTTEYAIMGFEVAQYYALNYHDRRYEYQYLEMMKEIDCSAGYIEYVIAVMMTGKLRGISRSLETEKKEFLDEFYEKYCTIFKWLKVLIPIAKRVGFQEFVNDDLTVFNILATNYLEIAKEKRILKTMSKAHRIHDKAKGTQLEFIKPYLLRYADKLAYKSLELRQNEKSGPMECDYVAIARYFYEREEYAKALEYEEIAAQLREEMYARDSVRYRWGERTLAKYLICNGLYDRAITLIEPIVISSNPSVYFRDENYVKQYKIDLSAELLIEAYREKGEVDKARQYRRIFEEKGLTKPVRSCKCVWKEYRYKTYLKYVPDKMPLDISSVETIILPPNVEIIEQAAFEKCNQIRCITIPNTLKKVEHNAFAGCDRLQDVYYNGTLEEWQNILICAGNEQLANAEVHTK